MRIGAPDLNVYFDGLCPLCSREIEPYRLLGGSERIRFVDITSPTFDADVEGVDPRAVHRHLHARDERLHDGVDAFIAIWKRLPKYGWAARLAAKPFLRPALDLGYAAFARVRPWLPHRKECAANPFCDTK